MLSGYKQVNVIIISSCVRYFEWSSINDCCRETDGGSKGSVNHYMSKYGSSDETTITTQERNSECTCENNSTESGVGSLSLFLTLIFVAYCYVNILFFVSCFVSGFSLKS